MQNQIATLRQLVLLVIFASSTPFFLTGCDSVTPAPDVTVQGAVTASAGYDADEGQPEPVEDAVVTAAAVGNNGQLLSLSGQTTTNADGHYSLTTESTAQPVRLRAEADGFTASVMLEAEALAGITTDIVRVPPMSAESTAEADVYVASRMEASAVTVADVSAHVSARTAASLSAGNVSAAEIATSVGTTVASERAYARHAQGGGATTSEANEARERRSTAYAAFRSDITAATTLQQRRAAVNTFLRAYAHGYASAGLTDRRTAEASLVASGAAQRFAAGTNAQARFATAHRARLVAALATALAVEEDFRAAGASDARLNALAQARTSLMASLHAAANASAVDAAWATYRSTVRTELAAELNVAGSAIDAAIAATGAARATLDAALVAAANADAVAAAYVAFFAAARSAVQGELGAGLGVNVIATMAAF